MKKKLVFIILFALFLSSCQESDLKPVYRLPTKLTSYYPAWNTPGGIRFIHIFKYDSDGKLLRVEDENGKLILRYTYNETSIECDHAEFNYREIFMLDDYKRIKSIYNLSTYIANDYYYNSEGYLIKELVWTLNTNLTNNVLLDSILYNYTAGNRTKKSIGVGSNESEYMVYTYDNTPNKNFGIGFECVYTHESWGFEYVLDIHGKPNANLVNSFNQYKINNTTGVYTQILTEKYTYELDKYGEVITFNIPGPYPDYFVFEYSDF